MHVSFSTVHVVIKSEQIQIHFEASLFTNMTHHEPLCEQVCWFWWFMSKKKNNFLHGRDCWFLSIIPSAAFEGNSILIYLFLFILML